MAEANPSGNPNHTLDARRAERAAEQIGQETVGRLSEVTAGQMEVWQKQMALAATTAHYWGDTFLAISQAIQQFVSQTQRIGEQSRRIG